MKVRDSGMPEEQVWESFFVPAAVLTAFGIPGTVRELVEFGCGYGTFTRAAARFVPGTVHALDIEPELVGLVREKIGMLGLDNVRVTERDFVRDGSGLADESMDAALLFNILHHDEPVALIAEARRVLRTGGMLAVIHWNHDPATPRGPSLDIRPRPLDCIRWAVAAGFANGVQQEFSFPPYHYGLKFINVS